jgi:hypothetical protein
VCANGAFSIAWQSESTVVTPSWNSSGHIAIPIADRVTLTSDSTTSVPPAPESSSPADQYPHSDMVATAPISP